MGVTTARKIERRRILRLQQVCERTGYSKPAIYRKMREGSFPQSVPLGAMAVGWLESEVDDWIDARVEVRDAALALKAGGGR
jgi:prophage regulatory protein